MGYNHLKNYTTLRPWYGSYPSRINYEREGITMRKRFRVTRLTISMIVLLLIGIIFILFSYSRLNQSLPSKLTHDLGIAFVVAAILGTTVDQFMRQSLAEDAFKASVGYLLPEELRPELEWIYNTTLLATSHRHDLVIESCQDNPEVVIVHGTISRTIKNIGIQHIPITCDLGIPEWFRPEGRSRIVSYKMSSKDDNKELSLENHKVEIARHQDVKLGNYILTMKSDEKITLRPNKTCTWTAEYEEYKHKNDETHIFSRIASKDSYITVRVPTDMDFHVTFGHRDQDELEDLGNGHFRLNGTLLPLQFIRVRWWNINDAKVWQEEMDKLHGKAKSN